MSIDSILDSDCLRSILVSFLSLFTAVKTNHPAFPEKKTDFFMVSMMSDEITELCYNSNMLMGQEG